MRICLRAFLGLFLLLTVSSVVHADWKAVAADLIKSEKPGFGGLSGVAVDRKSGEVFVFLSDKGLYRSTDQCKTWTKPDKVIKGRTETPGCIEIDPVQGTKRMSLALVYGSPLALSADMGQSWKVLNNKSGHVDWAAIDWSDADSKFILALKHESGGTLLVSRDGGQSFDMIGKDFGPAWIFDNMTAVASEMKSKTKPTPRLVRTTDGGKTFAPVGDYSAKALPRFFAGKLYWLTDDALIVSGDKGKTWTKVSDLKNGRFGPVFGKTAQQMFVLTTAGVIESSDAGSSWTKPLALPKEMKGINFMTWLDYDPINDILYTTRMSADLFMFERKK